LSLTEWGRLTLTINGNEHGLATKDR
jgi:hypothetical protein